MSHLKKLGIKAYLHGSDTLLFGKDSNSSCQIGHIVSIDHGLQRNLVHPLIQ